MLKETAPTHRRGFQLKMVDHNPVLKQAMRATDQSKAAGTKVPMFVSSSAFQDHILKIRSAAQPAYVVAVDCVRASHELGHKRYIKATTVPSRKIFRNHRVLVPAGVHHNTNKCEPTMSTIRAVIMAYVFQRKRRWKTNSSIGLMR